MGLTAEPAGRVGQRHQRRLVGLLLVWLLASVNTAFAGPQGGQVVAGLGSIGNPNPTTTLINQQSNRLVIDWTSFNVAANETVQFNQPSVSAAALNRILSQDPSQIFGNIIANGQIYLLNPNGIIFGKTATVNVGGLFATGLNINNSDFMSGKLEFAAPSGQDGGYIINHGVLQAADGGSINLIGSSVFNDGIIIANLGQVNMLGASAVTVDFNGDGLMQFQVTGTVLHKMANAESGAVVTNAGAIEAHGGTVVMTASVAEQVLMQAVNNSGIVQAGAIQNKNGHIYLTGIGENDHEQYVAPRNNPIAKINSTNSSGQAGGVQNQAGHIYLTGIGGDVINSGTLNADNANGNGGSITLQSTNSATVSGTISAQSLANGTGGQIEILGNQVRLLGHTNVNVSGALGGGTILVGGDFHGGDVQHAQDTRVDTGAVLTADATRMGNGGRVAVWSDGTTLFQGQINARALGPAGDGGSAEVSGAENLGITGHANLSSRGGHDGLLLLDPGSVTIQPGSNTPPGAMMNVFNDGWINAQLGSSSLTITTANSLDGLIPDLTVLAGANVTWATANSLTLIGSNSVTINGTINSTGTGGLILNSTGNISINSALTAGSLTVSTTGGNISQTAALTVSGGSSFATSATGTIALNNAANAFTGAVALTSGTGMVTLVNNQATVFGASTLGGALTVTSNGAITQTGALTVMGISSFGAGANTINLGAAINDFVGAVTLTNSGASAVSLNNGANALTLGSGTSVGSDLTLTSAALSFGTATVGGNLSAATTGAISQTGALVVTGTSNFSAGANAITLNNPGNDFTGAVSLINSGANNVALTSSAALTLGTVSVGSGTLALTGVGINEGVAGSITQAAGAGAATLSAGAGVISLGNTNDFTGAVTLTNSGANAATLSNGANALTIGSGTSIGGDLTLTSGALSFGGTTVGGSLGAVTTGAITQAGALTVTGVTTLAAGVANNITLSNAANAFTGAVGITSGNNVLLINNIATVLGASTVSGTLGVTSNGAITQTGALTVTGITTLAAGAANNITLNNPANAFTGAVGITSGNNVILINNKATALGASTISGTLAVTSNGAITQTGVLAVTGAATFQQNSLGAPATQNIALNTQANNFANTVTFATGAGAGINNLLWRNVNAAPGALFLPASISGNLTLTYNNAPIILPGISVGGALTVTSNGAITQSGVGALTVAGTSTLAAGAANNITLNNASNDFTGAVGITSGNNVSLTDVNSIILGTSNVSGTLNINASGSVTETGAITANTLTGTLTGAASAFNLNTFNNNIRNLGVSAGAGITAPSGFFLTNGNNWVNVNGVITTTNSPITINAGTGAFQMLSATSAFITGSGAITTTSDLIGISSTVAAGAFQTTGAVTLQPFSAGTTMSLAGGGGTFNLQLSEIAEAVKGITGAGSITIGTPGFSTGLMTIAGPVNFGSITASIYAGSFTDGGNIRVITAKNLNLTANNAGGAIGAGGGNNPIDVAVTNLTVNTNNGNAFITSSGGFNLGIGAIASSVGTGQLDLNVTTAGTITQTTAVTANSLTATLVGAGSALDLNGVSNNITSLGTAGTGITAPGGFALTDGNNPLTIVNTVATAGGAPVSITAGSITESGAGLINTTGMLTASTLTGQTLNGANTIGAFNATNITSGNISFTDTANPLTIAGATNAGGGSVTVNNSGALSITGAIIASGGGAVNLTATGASGSIIESGGGLVNTTGITTLTANAGNDITLAGANDFGAVSVVSGRNVVLNDVNAIQFSGASIISGTFGVTAIGITEAVGGTLAVAGSSNINAGAGVITLGNANDFTGAVTLTNSGANNVTLNNGANPLTLGGASNVGTGTLTLSSAGITEGGAGTIIQAAGAGAVTINAGAGVITLGNANNFTATVQLNNSGSFAVTLGNNNNLSLGASMLGSGIVSITAGGSITQSGAFVFGGAATFNATNSVTLNGSLTGGSSLNLNFDQGNSGATLDFGAATINVGTLAAGSGAGNDTFNLHNASITAATFTLAGGGGNDVLMGPTAGNYTWNITGADSGNVKVTGGGVLVNMFTGIGNLIGGTGNDSFTLASGVLSFNGSISGGGGVDTLAATDG
ncbi:MAG: two-partner secretion domain-containing protein, partial [Gammaproteobacteria bacterium]